VSATVRDIVFDCADQRAVARFWADVLDYQLRPLPADAPVDEPVVIEPRSGVGPRLWFNHVPEPKVGKNRMHIDITLGPRDGLEQLVKMGARSLREIRGADGQLWWTIMADIEGNEFCAFPSPA